MHTYIHIFIHIPVISLVKSAHIFSGKFLDQFFQTDGEARWQNIIFVHKTVEFHGYPVCMYVCMYVSKYALQNRRILCLSCVYVCVCM
jgi:hypothetical protein